MLGEQSAGDIFIESNILVFGQRTVYYKNMNLGLGLAYLDKTTRVNGSNLNYMLSIGYDWDKWYLVIRHISNAGTSKPNSGQDMLNIGYNFGR